MEHKNKSVFWEALILAIFIFAIGIFVGYLIEMNRTSKIVSLYQQSELDLLDVKIQNDIFNLKSIDCKNAFNETINFADRIYGEAKILEKSEEANQITSGITLQHKKYDLLRVSLWANLLGIKEKCSGNFTILVYMYEYNSEDLEIKSLQSVFSKKLSEVKQQLGNKVILIPMAGNLEVNSINYLKGVYNITSLPVILINEKVRIDSIDKLKNLTAYIK